MTEFRATLPSHYLGINEVTSHTSVYFQSQTNSFSAGRMIQKVRQIVTKTNRLKGLGTVVGRINAYKRRKILTTSICLDTILVLSYFLVES